RGELAEWSNAAVLKTVNCNRFGGSNPSLSARKSFIERWSFFRLGELAVLEVTTSSGSSIRFEPKGRAGFDSRRFRVCVWGRWGYSNPSLSARKSFIERWSFFRLGVLAVLEVTTSSRRSTSLRAELTEWSDAAILKAVNCNRCGGSNPSLSARKSFI